MNSKKVVNLVILSSVILFLSCMKTVATVELQKYWWEGKEIGVRAHGYKPWMRLTKVEGDSVYCRIDYTSDSKKGSLLLVLHKDSIEEIAKIKTRPHPFLTFLVGIATGGAISFAIVGLIVSN